MAWATLSSFGSAVGNLPLILDESSDHGLGQRYEDIWMQSSGTGNLPGVIVLRHDVQTVGRRRVRDVGLWQLPALSVLFGMGHVSDAILDPPCGSLPSRPAGPPHRSVCVVRVHFPHRPNAR